MKCDAQQNKNNQADSHVKIVKDKKEIIPSPKNKESFCAAIKALNPSKFIFTDSNSVKEYDYFFIEIPFKITPDNKIIFLEKIDDITKGIVEELEKIISETSWKNTSVNAKIIFSCKAYPSDLRDVCISSNDNFQQEYYCQ